MLQQATPRPPSPANQSIIWQSVSVVGLRQLPKPADEPSLPRHLARRTLLDANAIHNLNGSAKLNGDVSYFSSVQHPPAGYRRHAVVLFGGVGRLGQPSAVHGVKAFSENATVIDLEHTAAGYHTHVFGVQGHSVDVFIHSWSIQAKDEMLQRFNPVAWQFEDNGEHKNTIFSALAHNLRHQKCHGGAWCHYGQASMALSMSRALKLVAHHEMRTGHQYPGFVMVTRPDLLRWEDVKWDDFIRERVTTNTEDCLTDDSHCGNGDFQFVMTSAVARRFSVIFDWLGRHQTKLLRWGWIRAFITYNVTPGARPYEDLLHGGPCHGFDVYRRLCEPRCILANVSWKQIAPLGITLQTVKEMQRLNVRSARCCPLVSANVCPPWKPWPTPLGLDRLGKWLELEFNVSNGTRGRGSRVN